MKKIAMEEALAVAHQCGMQFIDLQALHAIPAEVIELLPADVTICNMALPINKIGDTVTIAIDDPLNTSKLEELRQLIRQFDGCEVTFYLAESDQLRGAIERYYPDEQVELRDN